VICCRGSVAFSINSSALLAGVERRGTPGEPAPRPGRANSIPSLVVIRKSVKGFDPVYGARLLRRYLQHGLETRIGRTLVSGGVLDSATIRIDVEGDHLTVSVDNPVYEEVSV
jgi:hypothetical protein